MNEPVVFQQLQLSFDEARTLTDEVKRDAEALWLKLVRLYEGNAHGALGYSSWHAYCQTEFGFGQSHAYRLLDAGRVAELFPHGGMNERQARELVPLLDDEAELLETWRELRERYGDRLTAEKVRQAVQERLDLEHKVGTLKSTGNAEWYTPATVVEAVRAVLGDIDLDPASNEHANMVVGARVFYDQATDGLAHDWQGRVFLNPPYGTICGQFVAKALDEYQAGQVTAAILLLNGYSFDVGWFRPLWDYPLCFTYGRIDFYSTTTGGTTTGSVFAYLGPDRERFIRTFGQLGAVVERAAA